MALGTTLQTETQASAQLHTLSDVLARVAGEMQLATGMADDCQAAVGEIFADNLHHEAALRLQALDLLTQHLSDLTRILTDLSQAAPMVPADLFDGIRLADLQRRLRGEDTAGADVHDDEFW